MSNISERPREFTGRHLFLILIAFFGVIIAVNVTMATLANRSWSGLVVPNSYVESQKFNDHFDAARARAALGWRSEMDYAAGQFSYRVTNGEGDAVRLLDVAVEFRRPVQEARDQQVALLPTEAGMFAGELSLDDGQWIVDISAVAPGLAEQWRDMKRIIVRNGSLQ
ncbi:MAG: FixH family protein [Mesorhizobium sp.]|nr:FixH family protein [Mesorhizobium sp.]